MATSPHPTDIKYSRQDRVLTVVFNTDEQFDLSAEFLRVHSPSAEVRGHGRGQEVLQTGKEDVAIDAIEPIGNYAVRLLFDDGHSTGLYSFSELHRLGSRRDELWQSYLEQLEQAGVQRRVDASS
ncbi:MAG: DUF971 family protein [Gammaproteobacteria bacterium]|jgi:DUF971 family protein